jgi:TruD family tRNA pseudouridine synthase
MTTRPPSDPLEALREQERATFEKLAERSPEVLTRPEQVDPDSVLHAIGIAHTPERSDGYLRFLPQDFIVEEITRDGSISTIEPSDTVPRIIPTDATLYADIVKIGIGTLEAVAHLTATLQIPVEGIRYAGLKDGRALTAQCMSLRGRAWSADLPRTFAQGFLKPSNTGNGAIGIGELRGNRFTILIRTGETPDASALSASARELSEQGFANFYGVQRFGNRLLNPQLGMFLCRNEVEAAIRLFLTASGPFDIPLLRSVREEASASYGDWPAMLSIFDQFPYTFRHERTLLSAITEDTHPARILGAIADQVRFWVYGYGAYLVNRLLSLAIAETATVPDPLPLVLTSDRADRLYAAFHAEDRTADYARHLRQYPFLIRKARTITPWITPELHGTAAVSAGAILSFSLPKAAYATTYLQNLFRLYEGSPVPSWVRPDPVDVKEILGTGSVTSALAALGESESAVTTPPALLEPEE